MSDYINDFTNHLEESLQIGVSAKLKPINRKFSNILICGLGGSGIGGSIVKDLIFSKAKIPIVSQKDYIIPQFVSDKTLIIVCSYSGNTEETLFALDQCEKMNSEITVITSGGKLKKIAEKKNYNHIIIPGGNPPRAMFGYSFVQMFFLLSHYNIINDYFKQEIEEAILLLNKEKEDIKKESRNLAKKVYKTTPIIYTDQKIEGAAIRFRQQINENSKMLCWHHVIPEMNHNELLGWRTNTDNLSVIYLRNKSDFDRNQVRIEINKKLIEKYTDNITEIWSKGNSMISNTLYHVHLGDWTSWYLSQMNKVDAIEIGVINYLKEELAKT